MTKKFAVAIMERPIANPDLMESDCHANFRSARVVTYP
jgi:hypothetical protein